MKINIIAEQKKNKKFKVILLLFMKSQIILIN